MKSLFTRFYLSVLALLALFAIAAFAAWHYLVEPPVRPGGARWVIELAREKLPPSLTAEQMTEQLSLWQRRIRADVLVVDLNGKPLARAGEPFDLPEEFAQWRLNRDEGWIKVVDSERSRRSVPWAHGVLLDGGDRRLFTRRLSRRHGADSWGPAAWVLPNPLRGLGVPLIVIALALGLVSYPLLRRLTKRIKALNEGVARFGQGDLSARVQVAGNDEIARVGNTFNQAANQVEGLVKAQRSLLANASHELRSPLARLKMAVELGAEAVSPRIKAEIDQNIGELDGLVDDILLSSRLQAAQASGWQMKAEAFALHDLIEQEVDAFALRGAVMPFVCDSPAQEKTFVGDARLVKRAVRNLLENAQRYASGKPIEVGLRLIEGGVEIQVEDHGPGVPDNERERIFEPFYRAKGASESSGGVGLGLALVKQIAQAHQGGVVCLPRSDGAVGSRFQLRLKGFES